jgi:molybdate transport system ATP-binding protein
MTIEARLEFAYPGLPELKFRFDLNLAEPGFTAVVGPSGAGKTTLLRCLAGLNRARGFLAIGGHIWQDEKKFLPTHRRPLGYVFQEGNLFPHLSVAGNLAYGAKRRDPKGNGRAGLEDGRKVLGIGHLLDRRPDTLSGGERQRVALARALAANPELLLLDEPLAALDQDRKEEILPYLEGLRRFGRPIIYVSHARDEVERLADTVLRLEPPA